MLGYSSSKIKDIVEKAVNHKWGVPEFQRGFVWKPKQVCDLVESLWLNYPVGTLLVWNSADQVETRGTPDAGRPSEWLVDGQQRATALCILNGRRPYWWDAEWDAIMRRYDIRFDVNAKAPPYFVVANAATKKVKETRLIPVRQLLVLDTEKEPDLGKLKALARQVKKDGFCNGMDEMEVFTRLERVRKVRDADVVLITIDNELEDVVDIFARLNGRGTRVTEADIYLGVVAAHARGWVRDSYLPFVKNLVEAGFDVTPNLVFRSLTGVGKKRIRFKFIGEAFWKAESIKPVWERTMKAWGIVIKHLREKGVGGNALLPTDNAFVPLVALADKFPDEPFDGIFYWFLQASRLGRYSSSSSTSLEEDLRHIDEASYLSEALEGLLKRLVHVPALTKADFLRDYSDARFGRLLLYLLVHRNGAIDWDQRGMRIGFDEAELLSGFQPQFHHVFPSAFLGNVVKADQVDALANIAIIGPAINIRISKQDPMNYFDRYTISDEKLRQQMISSKTRSTAISGYVPWLEGRAETLAKDGNSYLEELRGKLSLPVVAPSAQAEEHAYESA